MNMAGQALLRYKHSPLCAYGPCEGLLRSPAPWPPPTKSLHLPDCRVSPLQHATDSQGSTWAAPLTLDTRNMGPSMTTSSYISVEVR
jgi:hypothetical protein